MAPCRAPAFLATWPAAFAAWPLSLRRARGQRCHRLLNQFVDDLCCRLFRHDHADRLPRHDGAILDVTLDHRPTQRASPEVLDGKLCRCLAEFTGLEAIARLGLKAQEPL